MRSTELIQGFMLKVLLVVVAVSIFGCKFTGKSLWELKADGGVLKCLSEEIEQKTDDAIDDFMTEFMRGI